MPYGNLDFTHSGAIGGILAGRAFKQEQQQKAIETANAQADLEAKQLAAITQRDMTSALKLAGDEVKKTDDPFEKIDILVDAVSQYNPELAGELLSKSAGIRRDQAAATKSELETSLESTNIAASMLENITDGPSLVAMAQRAKMQGIDTKGVLDGLAQHYQQNGWDDALERGVQAGRQAVLDKKTQIAIQLDKERIATEQAQRRHYDAQTNILVPAQARAADALAVDRLKSGDKNTKVTTADKTLAKNLIAMDYEMDSPEDRAALNVFASEVTELAKDLLAEIPSLTKEEAVRRAYATMKKDDAFFGYVKKEAPTGSLRRPAPLPIGEDGKIDASKLDTTTVYGGLGKAYGKPVKWNGKEFVIAGAQ